MKDFTVYFLVRLVISIVQALSLRQARAFAEFMAWLANDVLHIRKRLLNENLRHAFPELSPKEIHKLSLKVWRHLFLMVIETAFAERKIHLSNWKKFVTLENEEKPLQALYEHRPLIYATGHLGNFEFAGYIMGLIGIPPYSVARTLDNPYLNDYLGEFRRSTGQAIIPKKDAAPLLDQAMKMGRSVVILTDQYAGEKGLWVKSFGRDVSTYKVVPILAKMFDAPVVLSAPIRHGEELFHFTIRVQEVLDPKIHTELTSPKVMAQWYNSVFEELIRMAPAQYWWIHNRWREKPKKQKKQ
ncbi:MAG: lipid A biosynthesis acyltransferase [Planctomycetaceae bacterium]|nr:lipid A biosynthesis acyltransferase [Planctomycetaceae bacterium]MBQ2820319.1 lipid A biosynthesis acyltransferase [Thermoguttaceae bacterium]